MIENAPPPSNPRLATASRVRVRMWTLATVLAAQAACHTDPASLELTVRDYGIAFGNADVVHGVRLNAVDDGPLRVDGMNFTLAGPRHADDLEVNGISLGLWRPEAAVHRGVALGPLVAGRDLTGVHVGILGASSSGDLRGVNTSLVLTRAEHRLIGLNAAAIVGGGGDVGPLTVGGLAITDMRMSDLDGPHAGTLFGIAIAGVRIDFPRVLGLAASGVFRAHELGGAAFSYLWTEVSGTARGIQLAPFNQAGTLRGVQFGILNHVASHPWYLRWLPLVNVGFSGAPPGTVVRESGRTPPGEGERGQERSD